MESDPIKWSLILLICVVSVIG